MGWGLGLSSQWLRAPSPHQRRWGDEHTVTTERRDPSGNDNPDGLTAAQQQRAPHPARCVPRRRGRS
eukprot:COSAG01_NODE_32907_length_573_cov_1.086498_1_plen_66_part_01